jgi:hypothetical protein
MAATDFDLMIDGRRISRRDPCLVDLLKDAYSKKLRPLCLCQEGGIEMYIAQINHRFYLKRMPSSAGEHHSWCNSYEPPAQLSGLGEVMGEAITEDQITGDANLKLAFSLSQKKGGRAPAPTGESVSDTVSADPKRLTLLSLFHYLWERGKLNQWRPDETGRKNWAAVRQRLLLASASMTTKNNPLAQYLYIPETFFLDRKEEIENRRLARLMTFASEKNGSRPLMLLIGEVKSFDPSRYGFKAVIKHMPEKHIMLDKKLYERLQKRFMSAMEMWDELENSHLLVIGTVNVSVSGRLEFLELSLILVNEEWLPIENGFDHLLVTSLMNSGRHFTKGLRYNMGSDRPLAFAVLTDTSPKNTALYVVPPGAIEDYREALDELVEDPGLNSWVWDMEAQEEQPSMPDAVKLLEEKYGKDHI